MKIDPTEKRDQHCKVYVEKSVKNAIYKFAYEQNLSFSEASRMLLIIGLESK